MDSTRLLLSMIWIVFSCISVGKATTTKCNKKIDLVFLLDASASIGEENFTTAKKFIKNTIQYFYINPVMTRVAVVPYSLYYQPANYFTNGVNEKYVDKIVDDLTFQGSITRLTSSLKVIQYDVFSKLKGARWHTKGVRHIVVVITDGGSNSSFDGLISTSSMLKDSGKTIFAVALGNSILKENIERFVSTPHAKHIFTMKGKDKLRETVESLVEAICTDDIVGLNILEY